MFNDFLFSSAFSSTLVSTSFFLLLLIVLDSQGATMLFWWNNAVVSSLDAMVFRADYCAKRVKIFSKETI